MKDINSPNIEIPVEYYSKPTLNRGLIDDNEAKKFISSQCNNCSKKESCSLFYEAKTFDFSSSKGIGRLEILCYFPNDDQYYRDNFYDLFEEKTSGIFKCKLFEKTKIDYESNQYLFDF